MFSIINKCIQYLPTEQVDAYLVTHSANTKEVSMLEFIEQHLWQVGCIVILVLSIIILLIGSNLRNALRSNRRIQDLLYKDELTGLYNMNGFYQKWEENNTPSKQQSFVVLYNGFWKKIIPPSHLFYSTVIFVSLNLSTITLVFLRVIRYCKPAVKSYRKSWKMMNSAEGYPPTILLSC